MRVISKQAEEIETLQRILQERTTHGKDYEMRIEQLNTELLSAEKEISKLKKAVDIKHNLSNEFDRAGSERAVATAREVMALNTELESLKSAVAFLREENARYTRIDLS